MQTLQYNIPPHLKNHLGKLSTELAHFFTPERFAKMQRIAKERSRHVLVVFENTHHAHNASAILRTVDSFGFLDLFFLQSNAELKFRTTDAVDRRASQWLLPKRLTSITECATLLKQGGYKIALVTLPDFSRTAEHYQKQIPAFSCQNFQTPEFKNFLGEDKIALIFGGELMGIYPEWQAYADCYIYVPMSGFTESLNVSVCAGIILHSLREFLQKCTKNYLLKPEEHDLILEYWLSKTYPHGYEYIAGRKPELLEWFEYVRSGKFLKVTT